MGYNCRKQGLPFFLPSRLIELEYFEGKSDPEYEEEARPYRKDIDFAFFVVNFGYSKADYNSLTPREKNFIYKAWESKQVSELSNMYQAAFTAGYNLGRPKRKRPLKLFKKKKTQKADMDIIQENLNTIKEVSEKEGNAWIKQIYKANNLRFPERRVNG